MNIIKKQTNYFGTTIFEYFDFVSSSEGIQVMPSNDSRFVVLDKYSNTCHKDIEYTNGIIETKHKQKLGIGNRYTIYFIRNSSMKAKGVEKVSIIDISYNNTIEDVMIPYDISISIAKGREEKFINFINSNNLLNGTTEQTIINLLKPSINVGIDEVIKRETRLYTIENLMLNSQRVSNLIVEYLNSNRSDLFNNGFIVEDFKFTITEDYNHLEEKKLVQKNNAIYKNVKSIKEGN